MVVPFSRESFPLYQVYRTKMGVMFITQKANYGKIIIELVCGFS